MLTDDFAEDLPARLRAALDQASLPDPGWQAARSDIVGRIRRRRARGAAASSAVAVLVALAVALAAAARTGHGDRGASGHEAPPAARLSELASASLGGGLPPRLAYAGSQVFAATGDGRLLRLDAATLKVTGQLRVGRPASAGLQAQSLPLVYGDHAVWILDQAGRQLWRVDPASMRVTRRLPVGQASELAYGGGSLWLTACCTVGAHENTLRLERLDPATGRVTGSVGLPGDGRQGWGVGASAGRVLPNGIGVPLPPVVLAAGRVVLVAGPNSRVFAVDPRTLAVLRAFRVGCDGCERPLAVAIGPAGLYATSIDDVVRLDLATGQVAAAGATAGLGVDSASPAALVAGPGGVWLLTGGPCTPRSSVVLLDPITLKVSALLPIQSDGSVLPVGADLYTTDSGGAVARFAPAGR